MTQQTPSPPPLTPEQLQSYNDNGYLIIPNALPPPTITALKTETNTLLTTIDLTTHPLTQFTTGDSSSSSPSSSTPHIGDDYFLTSGDKIRFFFEPSAFTPHLSLPPHLAINKIGHSLHSLSPPFRTATFTAHHGALARSLGFSDPRVLQSMLICKQPSIGAAVSPHQDSTFLYTDPPSAVGFWFALEDAGAGNGGLSFARGSHRRVGVGRRLVRMREGEGGTVTGTGFVECTGAKFPAASSSSSSAPSGENKIGMNGNHQKKAVDDTDDGEKEEEEEEEKEEIYTPETIPAGSLVLIHGNVLHKSEANTSAKSRFAYTFHVIEGNLEYDDRNWLQPPKGGFARLFGDGKEGE